jgi:hypothetical protein
MIRLLALLGIMLLAGQSPDGLAVELLCTDHDIVVQGTEQQDLKDACEAMTSAAPFFEIAGLSMPKGVSIRLVDGQSPPLLATHEMGSYDATHNSIRVLAYQFAVIESENADPGVGKIVSRDHWRSYIVHELTHAAIHLGCKENCPSRAMHEYVAAVAQLSSLPKRVLAEVLSTHRYLEPFNQLSEVSETYYAINPRFFAVKSYKHYQQLSEPSTFLRRVLRPVD